MTNALAGRSRIALNLLVVLLTGTAKSLPAQEANARQPVKFPQDSMEVPVGDTVRLPTTLPGGLEEEEPRLVRWTSADTSVARVDDHGHLTTRRLESTWIIASYDEDADSILVTGGMALTDEAFVVDSTELNLVSSPEQLEEGEFEFTLRSDTTVRPQTGNVIVGNQRGGFLRQVEGVEPLGGNRILLFTSDATLPDVLLAGTVGIDVPLTLRCSSDDLLALGSGAGVQLASWTGSAAGKSTSLRPLSSAPRCGIDRGEPENGIRYGPVEVRDLGVDVRLTGGGFTFVTKVDEYPLSLLLEGNVVVRPKASLDYKVNRFLRVPRGVAYVDLRFTSSQEGSTRTTLAFADSSARDDERELARFERPFAGYVGPLPVAGRVSVKLYAGHRAKGNTRLTLRSGRQRITSEVDARLRWEGGAWGDLEVSRDFNFHRAPVRYFGNASLESRVYVRPELQFVLYEVAGPSASLIPYVEGEAKVSGKSSTGCSIAADLEAGIDGSVGVTWTRFSAPVANLFGVGDIKRQFPVIDREPIARSVPRAIACP